MSWFCCGVNRKDKPTKSVAQLTHAVADKEREKLVISAKVSSIPVESLQVERVVKGIDNMGNSCYINAAIECLSNTNQLSEYILTGQWEKDANAVNPIGTDGQLLIHYVQLVHKLWDSKGKNVINPKHFKECLDKICPTVKVSLFSLEEKTNTIPRSY